MLENSTFISVPKVISEDEKKRMKFAKNINETYISICVIHGCKKTHSHKKNDHVAIVSGSLGIGHGTWQEKFILYNTKRNGTKKISNFVNKELRLQNIFLC